jgi:hypothetical protein
MIIDIVVAEAGTAPAPPAFSAFRFERYAIKSGTTSPEASRDRTEAVQACRADAAHPSRMSAASLIRRKPVGRSPASAPSASSAPVSRTLGTGMARIVARQALMSPTPLTILDRAFSRAALILIILFPARPSRLKVISMPSARKKVCARRSRPASRGVFCGALRTRLALSGHAVMQRTCPLLGVERTALPNPQTNVTEEKWSPSPYGRDARAGTFELPRKSLPFACIDYQVTWVDGEENAPTFSLHGSCNAPGRELVATCACAIDRARS